MSDGAPRQVRHESGLIDNYCPECGNLMSQFVPSENPDEPRTFRHVPEHDLHCDSRDFVIRPGPASADDLVALEEYVRSKKLVT